MEFFSSVNYKRPCQQLNLKTGKIVGIDVGIECAAVSSDGKMFKRNKNNIKNHRKKLTKAQRKFSKTKRESKNHNKRKLKLQKVYKHIANDRKNFNHWVSSRLVDNQDGTQMNFEKLRLQGGIMKSAKGTAQKHGKNVAQKKALDRALAEAGLYQLKQFTKYKLEAISGKLIEVDPKFTSQKCSNCGYVSKDNRKTQSCFHCENCGADYNADYNAAINIARRADSAVKPVLGKDIGLPIKQEALEWILQESIPSGTLFLYM